MPKKVSIAWKGGFNTEFIKSGEIKNVTHRVTSMHIDNFTSKITVNIEKGINVNTITISMQDAIIMGFIDFDALKKYCI